MTQRVINEGVLKEDGILKVDIRKKVFSDVKQSWRCAKAAEVEKKSSKLQRKM